MASLGNTIVNGVLRVVQRLFLRDTSSIKFGSDNLNSNVGDGICIENGMLVGRPGILVLTNSNISGYLKQVFNQGSTTGYEIEIDKLYSIIVNEVTTTTYNILGIRPKNFEIPNGFRLTLIDKPGGSNNVKQFKLWPADSSGEGIDYRFSPMMYTYLAGTGMFDNSGGCRGYGFIDLLFYKNYWYTKTY